MFHWLRENSQGLLALGTMIIAAVAVVGAAAGAWHALDSKADKTATRLEMERRSANLEAQLDLAVREIRGDLDAALREMREDRRAFQEELREFRGSLREHFGEVENRLDAMDRRLIRSEN
ncbi:MAG: hypothetical protein OXF33_12840 [Rhodospirillales bacterium]|nr:hypothetical protein [Rhodospirillales bacterium]